MVTLFCLDAQCFGTIHSAPNTTEYQPSPAVLPSLGDHLGSEGGDFWTCGDMCGGVTDAEHTAPEINEEFWEEQTRLRLRRRDLHLHLQSGPSLSSATWGLPYKLPPEAGGNVTLST